jgi:hypothetical protein
VYVVTASPHVLGGDAGEFATVGALGGVPHPPGYPLYVLWLRALVWLPARSPAHATALATAVLGAGAVWMLQRACGAWGASRGATAIVSAAFAFSPLAWDLSTHAEVFALNTLLGMAIVALAAPGAPRVTPRPTDEARTALLGLAAGLGLSNHHSVVLLAPIGLFAAGTAVRRARRPWVAAALGVGALAIGLSPYAYLVTVARTTPPTGALVWGDTRTLGGLVHHFLRADYGTTSLSANPGDPRPLVNLASLARDLVVGLFGVPLAAALGGILAARRARLREHAALAVLVLSFVLVGPAFVSRFDLGSSGVQPTIAARFHLLPAALSCVLASLGLDALARAWFEAHGGVVALAVAVARAATAWPAVGEAQRPTVEHYMENALHAAPPRAILLATSDAAVGAFFYEKLVLGRREDVVLVSPPLLLGDWFPRRVSAELGFEIERGHPRDGEPSRLPHLETAPLVLQLLASGRPVVAGDWLPLELAEGAPSYPVGPLVRLVPDPRAVPDPYALEARNVALFDAFALEDRPPRRDSWGAALWAGYARTWASLAAAFAARGDPAHAEACRVRGARFAFVNP